MNLICKRFILICLFGELFFSCVSASIYNGDCTTPEIACASGSGGAPTYDNPLFTSPDIDFQSVVDGDLAMVYLDSSEWDPSWGKAFVITLKAGSSYSVAMPQTFALLEAPEEANFRYAITDYIRLDEHRDDNTSFVTFEIYGSFTETRGNFINQGETIIAEGGEINYIIDPSLSTYYYFYSDIFTIGGTGGMATFNFDFVHLSFHTGTIQNAVLNISSVNEVTLGDKARELYVLGNVTMNFSNLLIDNAYFTAPLEIYLEEDNNVISFLDSRFSWIVGSVYVADTGPSMYFSCSSVCQNNSITVTNSQFHLDDLFFTGVSDFNIILGETGFFDAENYMLESSQVSVDARAEDATFQIFLRGAGAGTMKVDSNSSFTVNVGSTGQLGFYAGSYINEGQMEFIFEDDSTLISSASSEAVRMTATKDINFYFKGSSRGSFGTMNFLEGDTHIYVTDGAIIEIHSRLQSEVPNTGELIIDLDNNATVIFNAGAMIKDTTVTLNQQVYVDTYHNVIRFAHADLFLDDNLVYKYNVNSTVKSDFGVNDLGLGGLADVVVIQIVNPTAGEEFPYIYEVSDKINAGGDAGGGEDPFFSVLIDAEGEIIMSNLIDYKTIGTLEYAEFGLIGRPSGGGPFSYNRAQDQYGEEDGLLTLTTIENSNSYEIAVIFDNIVLSDTDREPYRVSLFYLVINNSRTVEQLGNTLNSLNANATLSNILYGSSIFELTDKKNTKSLLDGERVTTYGEIRHLSSKDFKGRYLVFGGSLIFFQTPKYRLGISGLFSPYKSSTDYDIEEQSNNISASLFGASQISEKGIITFNFSIMNSKINGTGLNTLGMGNERQYNYGGNSTGATIAYNFGNKLNHRALISLFKIKSSTYKETASDLSLNVTMPSYKSVFAGYYLKLLEEANYFIEVGLKYYLVESQEIGKAGFINDPAAQKWGYVYILLDSPVELNVDFSYKILQDLELKTGINKRGGYNNIGVYILYKKDLPPAGEMTSDDRESPSVSPNVDDLLEEEETVVPVSPAAKESVISTPSSPPAQVAPAQVATPAPTPLTGGAGATQTTPSGNNTATPAPTPLTGGAGATQTTPSGNNTATPAPTPLTGGAGATQTPPSGNNTATPAPTPLTGGAGATQTTPSDNNITNPAPTPLTGGSGATQTPPSDNNITNPAPTPLTGGAGATQTTPSDNNIRIPAPRPSTEGDDYMRGMEY